MATTVVNFDGLSPEAAEKMAGGLASAIRQKIEILGKHATEGKFSSEVLSKLEKVEEVAAVLVVVKSIPYVLIGRRAHSLPEKCTVLCSVLPGSSTDADRLLNSIAQQQL